MDIIENELTDLCTHSLPPSLSLCLTLSARILFGEIRNENGIDANICDFVSGVHCFYVMKRKDSLSTSQNVSLDSLSLLLLFSQKSSHRREVL